jgi:glutamate synthase (ferredoxin)
LADADAHPEAIAIASGLSGDDALTAAFEENARDVARIGGS